jgi:rhamnulokinase
VGKVDKTVSVLAFDLGAGSGRALIGELLLDGAGKKRLNITEVHRFPNVPVHIGDHLYWDILLLLQEVKNGIRKAFQAGFKPESFSIDTWGVDFGLLDRNGELLGNPYHYRDSQTEGLIEEICDLIGREKLFLESGLQFMPFNTIYQLYAMKKANSPKLEQAETLLLTPDLLMYFLTGEKVCEFTMATTTQLFNPITRSWNSGLMDQLGIPSHIFLDPLYPGIHFGHLTDAVRRELDVPSMKAVSVGSHDTESAVAAVPTRSSNFAYLVCGTWSLLGTELQEASIKLETLESNFSNEGGVGGTYQLLKNIMGLWLLQECKRRWDLDGKVNSFSDLVNLAEGASAFRSIVDPDDLRFMNPGNMLEEIQAYCRDTKQPIPLTEGEAARCILESLALRYRASLEQAEKIANVTFNGLHMVGGGIQNGLLCQFTANAIGRPVWAGPVEASAIGNILVQFTAINELADMGEARELVRRSFPVLTYEPQDYKVWEEAFQRFSVLTGI